MKSILDRILGQFLALKNQFPRFRDFYVTVRTLSSQRFQFNCRFPSQKTPQISPALISDSYSLNPFPQPSSTKKITHHWVTTWQQQPRSNKLLQIKRLPFSWPVIQPGQQTAHEILLTRLWIGHSRLTHAHIFTQLLFLLCHHCLLDHPPTIKHIFECPSLTPLWSSLHLPHSLKATNSSPNLPPLQNIITYLCSANSYPAYDPHPLRQAYRPRVANRLSNQIKK